ncbi:conserved hypothetical protein [metagenome]|uniref:Uncharacterized protein n=1 Tax=metagenome TaxID=256318 RepID=A0A2P2CAY9_9ZZZZ
MRHDATVSTFTSPCRRTRRSSHAFVRSASCTKLFEGVLKQADLVREVVGSVPVTGAVCLVEADWPLVGGAFTTRGVHVLWPKRFASIFAEGIEGRLDVSAVRSALSTHSKPA